MNNNYRCPQCGSGKVRIDYPDIRCLDCGWSEPYDDYPTSWSVYRAHCQEFGKPDPGPCEPPEHCIEELLERLTTLEELVQSFQKPKPAGGVKL